METIEVQLDGQTRGLRNVRFVGEWLVHPGDEIRSGEPGYDLGAYYGVAVTRRQKIAVYCAHINGRFDASLEVYDSLKAAENDGMPEDIIVAARSELDPNYVQELDI